MKKSKIKALVCAGLLSVSALSMTACNNKPNNPATVVWTADSAYVRALDEGFSGTFEEFLETLSGIKQAEINSNGNLILKLGDGSTIDVGKVKGNNGFTPEIGANGNWWIGGVDTTIKAQGEKGEKGDTGVGIAKVETTADRWGLIVTTIYTYSDSTTETPHIEEISVNNGASFGRVYDATSSEELVYLLSNGVTNIAITSTSENFDLTSAVTCNIKTTPIYDASSNQYLHYIFDLNGHTLNFTENLTFDGVNVLIKNGFVVEGETRGIIKENNAEVTITHTFEKNIETLSQNSTDQASGIINEINTKVYNSPSLAGSTRYTLKELNTALGENALTNYYVEVEQSSVYYKNLTIGGTTYKKGQIVSLSIGNNNFIDAEAYYVQDGKLYICAPIVATASAEQAPYTIKGLAYDKSAFDITDKGNNEYDVVVKNGTSILYIQINSVAQSDIFLRKATDNGKVTFGFTTTDKVPNNLLLEEESNKDIYSYGLYPAGWINDISQYAGFTREFNADLYIVGKGTVHFKLNITIPSNI